MAKNIDDFLVKDAPLGLDGERFFQHFVGKEEKKAGIIYSCCTTACFSCNNGGGGGTGGPKKLTNGKEYKLPENPI